MRVKRTFVTVEKLPRLGVGEATMGTPGPMELVIILLVALLIFGPGKLPQIGEGLGKGIQGFRRAISGKDKKETEPSSSEQSGAEEERKETPGH